MEGRVNHQARPRGPGTRQHARQLWQRLSRGGCDAHPVWCFHAGCPAVVTGGHSKGPLPLCNMEKTQPRAPPPTQEYCVVVVGH